MIDTIIFDLGGVLVDWDPRYLYRKLFDSEAEMDYFLTHICSPEWNIRQDAGRPFSEANRILLDQYPEYEEAIRAFYGRWDEMLAGDISGTVGLLQDLARQQRHRLLALTNWSHETFPIAEERFAWLGHFEGIVVSGRVKLAKPDPRIYHFIRRHYTLRPERSLFIDDNPANVEAAGRLGFQTIRFHSPEQLEAELEKRNIRSSSG